MGGALTGGAFGAAMALGGAAGLTSTGVKIVGYGLTVSQALGISVGVTVGAGLASYSLNCEAYEKQWKSFGFVLSGVESGLQGLATFGLANVGEKSGFLII